MTAPELRRCHLWKLYGGRGRESNTGPGMLIGAVENPALERSFGAVENPALERMPARGNRARGYWVPKSSGETESMNSLNCSTTSSACFSPATAVPSAV